MPDYQPAILSELEDDEPTGREHEGEAIMTIFRNERGVMNAAGTFRQGGRPDDPAPRFGVIYAYEGVAFENGKRCEVTVPVALASGRGELFELEASAEPVVLQ